MIFCILAIGTALIIQAPDQAPDQVQASAQSQPSSQTQVQAPQVVRVAALGSSRPVAAEPVDAGTASFVSEVAVGDLEPDLEPVRTRQACRYIEVTGQRFPVRSCRTVVIEQDER